MFFEASKDALNNITYIFDFIHSVNVSMRYTKHKVEKIVQLNPLYENGQIKKIIDPEEKVHGVNYRKTFLEEPWNVQEEKNAWLLLNNLFAIHEGWAQRLYSESFCNFGYSKKFIKNLEFPKLSNKITTFFVTSDKKSLPMKEAFFEKYRLDSDIDFTKLDNYMLCYRAFKEARNCFMHENFVASEEFIDAYNKYIPVATTTSLNVEEVPVFPTPSQKSPIKLSLRGIIGFSQIIRKIIIIMDTYLLQTKAGEQEFLNRTSNLAREKLSSNKEKSKNQIKKFSRKAGFLESEWSEEYQNFLISNGLFIL